MSDQVPHLLAAQLSAVDCDQVSLVTLVTLVTPVTLVTINGVDQREVVPSWLVDADADDRLQRRGGVGQLGPDAHATAKTRLE